MLYSETTQKNNAITINTSVLPKGVYFYKLVDTTTGFNLKNGKLIKFNND
jgi:hypothetical protein